ncbi:hypothetical protein BGW38_000259 [Lunasporangiospora selenospora]|uniref:Uncharacterized protein n=1 Tax=Lunasporangiospora selenospora TaxID=979761 RepID=A0A9P6KF53_9FUNG|nr:hypothetical protein BGW38_000259 [Lunasporangiospora selenospora]
MSDSQNKHPTAEPFTDPNPNSESARQKAAKVIALPLAAVGGAVTEATRKAKELISGHPSNVDTSHDKPSSSH